MNVLFSKDITVNVNSEYHGVLESKPWVAWLVSGLLDGFFFNISP
jgi:hypothetical protein